MHHPIYNGAKPEYPTLYSFVFLAASKGLRCAFAHLLSPALRPTSVWNNGVAKAVTFGSGVERKEKEMPGNGHFSRIPKPFLCCQLWCEMYPHTKIRCYGKDRDYKTNSNKSKGKVKLLTSSESHVIIWMGT